MEFYRFSMFRTEQVLVLSTLITCCSCLCCSRQTEGLLHQSSSQWLSDASVENLLPLPGNKAPVTGAAYSFTGATTSLTNRILTSSKKITLVRHGLSSWNAESRVQVCWWCTVNYLSTIHPTIFIYFGHECQTVKCNLHVVSYTLESMFDQSFYQFIRSRYPFFYEFY